jgi:hypothetical protein
VVPVSFKVDENGAGLFISAFALIARSATFLVARVVDMILFVFLCRIPVVVDDLALF